MRAATVAAALALAFLGAGEVLDAAYPGENGRIAFHVTPNAGGEAMMLTDGGGGMDSDRDWQPRLPLQGDTDCDGDVDSVDGLNVLRDTAGFPPALCIDSGDVDCDDDRDSVDGIGVLRHVAALPPLETPPECPLVGEPLAPLAGGVLATFMVVDEQFSVWVRNADTIQQLFDLKAGKSAASIPVGPIVEGPGRGAHNAPWSWHIDPDAIEMAEATIEPCDGLPSHIEDDLEYWIGTVGQYCPWSAELIELQDYR